MQVLSPTTPRSADHTSPNKADDKASRLHSGRRGRHGVQLTTIRVFVARKEEGELRYWSIHFRSYANLDLKISTKRGCLKHMIKLQVGDRALSGCHVTQSVLQVYYAIAIASVRVAAEPGDRIPHTVALARIKYPGQHLISTHVQVPGDNSGSLHFISQCALETVVPGVLWTRAVVGHGPASSARCQSLSRHGPGPDPIRKKSRPIVGPTCHAQVFPSAMRSRCTKRNSSTTPGRRTAHIGTFSVLESPFWYRRSTGTPILVP